MRVENFDKANLDIFWLRDERVEESNCIVYPLHEGQTSFCSKQRAANVVGVRFSALLCNATVRRGVE